MILNIKTTATPSFGIGPYPIFDVAGPLPVGFGNNGGKRRRTGMLSKESYDWAYPVIKAAGAGARFAVTVVATSGNKYVVLVPVAKNAMELVDDIQRQAEIFQDSQAKQVADRETDRSEALRVVMGFWEKTVGFVQDAEGSTEGLVEGSEALRDNRFMFSDVADGEIVRARITGTKYLTMEYIENRNDPSGGTRIERCPED